MHHPAMQRLHPTLLKSKSTYITRFCVQTIELWRVVDLRPTCCLVVDIFDRTDKCIVLFSGISISAVVRILRAVPNRSMYSSCEECPAMRCDHVQARHIGTSQFTYCLTRSWFDGLSVAYDYSEHCSATLP